MQRFDSEMKDFKTVKAKKSYLFKTSKRTKHPVCFENICRVVSE
jgi:hypothetical protein